MPRILGYGEDALTLWALNSRLPTLLTGFGDDSSFDEAVVMYRPSFGRSSGRVTSNNGRRAEFGEFDAIVGTRQRVHLVEAKWEGSSELEADGTVRLRREQRTRHLVFTWYLNAWRESPGRTWASFVDRGDEHFRTEFPHLKMAPAGTRLAQNLEFVLKQLAGCSGETQNILLYFHFSEKPRVTRVEPGGFKLVTLRAALVPDSMYLDVAVPGREMADAEKSPDAV